MSANDHSNDDTRPSIRSLLEPGENHRDLVVCEADNILHLEKRWSTGAAIEHAIVSLDAALGFLEARYNTATVHELLQSRLKNYPAAS